MTNAGHNAIKASESPLWIYAVKQYKSPACAQFLLEAQNEQNLDINILLFIGWLASQQRCLKKPMLVQAHAHQWQQNVIIPLRDIRKHAKSMESEELYPRLLKLELAAEMQELLALFRLATHIESNNEGFTQNVRLGCKEYFSGLALKIDEHWLQTLTKHLQPINTN